MNAEWNGIESIRQKVRALLFGFETKLLLGADEDWAALPVQAFASAAYNIGEVN